MTITTTERGTRPCDTLDEALRRLATAAVLLRKSDDATRASREALVADLSAEVVRLGGPAWAAECAATLLRGESFTYAPPPAKAGYAIEIRRLLTEERATEIACLRRSPVWTVGRVDTGVW